MAVRLRPQSAAWMAPHALAAQLTAQTGQIAGQGVAGLLGGIAQGVGAFTQKREARRAEAINESRYQDSIARQDRAFKYGAAQDQMALAQRYAQGLEVKAQGELASKGTVDPSTVAELQKIASSMKALSAQGAQIGGVQAADIPDVDYSKMVSTQPAEEGSYSREDAIRLAQSMRNMNDDELSGIASFYAANAKSARIEANNKKEPGPIRSRLLSEASNYELLDMMAQNEMGRRSGASKLSTKQAEADIEANKQIRVDAAKKQTDIAADEAERKRINDARVARGERPIESLRELGPQMTTDRVVSENAKKAEATAAIRREILDLRKRDMALKEAKFQLEKQGDSVAASKVPMQRRQVLTAIVSAADNTMRNLSFPIDSETEDQKSERLKMFEAAKAELIQATIDLREVEKEILAPPAPAAGAAPQAATTSPTADPKASAAAEFKALPKEQQTLEVWTAIKAKHGIK